MSAARSLLSWGLPLGLWSAFIVSIFPSIQSALTNAVQNYPSALKQAFGIGELSSVEQYLHAEMLSLIVPLAVGYLAVRSIASGLSGASPRASGSTCCSPRRSLAGSWSRPVCARRRSSLPQS